MKKFITALLKAIAVLLGLAMVSALSALLCWFSPVIYIIISVFALLGFLIWAFYDD